MTTYTLCFIRKNGKVLLGMKKRGFGVGRWNGFGGKVLPNESIEEAAKRELEEETGIVPRSIEQKGVLTFSFADNPEKLLPVYVFEVLEFSGQPQESEEMRPQWFAEDAIPYGKMWQSDRIWFPEFLKGHTITARFHFKDADDDEVLWHEIKH